jgi:hypothetical protein
MQSEELPLNDLGQRVGQEALIGGGNVHQLASAQRQAQQQQQPQQPPTPQQQGQQLHPAHHRPPVGGVQIYPPGVVSYFNNL